MFSSLKKLIFLPDSVIEIRKLNMLLVAKSVFSELAVAIRISHVLQCLYHQSKQILNNIAFISGLQSFSQLNCAHWQCPLWVWYGIVYG